MIFYLFSLAALLFVVPVTAASEHVHSIETLAEYNKAFKSDKPLVTLISGTWCGPCKAMKPHYHKVAAKNTDITFCILDVDNTEFESLYEKWSIRGVPALLFSHKGKRFADLDTTGGLKTHEIEQKIANFRYEIKQKAAAEKTASKKSSKKTTDPKKADTAVKK